MMRGRIVSVGGVAADKVHAKESAQWVLEGDRGVTYAATLPKGAVVTAGAWWPADYAGPPLVSVDGDIAKGLGLKLGDNADRQRARPRRDRQGRQFPPGRLAHVRDQFRAGVLARTRSPARRIRC